MTDVGGAEPNHADGRLPDVELSITALPELDARGHLTPSGPGRSALGAAALGAGAAGAAIEHVVVDVPAFETFYRDHRDQIGRALALTLRDAALAADAVDEAMARAYQRWGQVATLANPSGWVYRVGLNWSRSVLRRRHRPAPIWVAAPGVEPPPAIADPAIDTALAALSIDQRAVVVCRFLIGCSEAQTAALLGVRPGTVKSRLSRALDRLRVLLRDQDPHQEDDRA